MRDNALIRNEKTRYKGTNVKRKICSELYMDFSERKDDIDLRGQEGVKRSTAFRVFRVSTIVIVQFRIVVSGKVEGGDR